MSAMTISCVFADASKVYVKTANEGGDDLAGDGSWEKPFATIRGAIASVESGGWKDVTVISVQPGTYPGGIRQDGGNILDIRAQKRVNGVDVDNPNPRETIIDGGGTDHCVWLRGGGDNGHRISGFTLTNGVWTTTWTGEPKNSPIGGAGLVLESCGGASNMVVCGCSTMPDGERKVLKAQAQQWAAVAVSTATISDFLIYDCTNSATAYSTSAEINGAGLRLQGATARRCVISNCWSFVDNMLPGNRRGGGVYLDQNQESNLLDSCKVIDCGIVRLANGNSGTGGGICALPKSGVITNCLVSGCMAKGEAGGIACSYGCGLIVDTTVTNCWVEEPAGGTAVSGIYVANSTALADATIRRCRIVDCRTNWDDWGSALYMNCGIAEDCVIENCSNAKTIVLGGDVIVRDCAICNNETKGSVFDFSSSKLTAKVERCWIAGNTLDYWSGNIFNRALGYNMNSVIDSCIVTGNTACSCFSIADSTRYTTEGMSSSRISNCTVVNNVLAGPAAVFTHADASLYPQGGPGSISLTNCLLTANKDSGGNTKPAVNDYFQTYAAYGVAAYCATETAAADGLPLDGSLHNQVGNTEFQDGTLMPRSRSVAREHGYAFPWMREDDAKDMGDGSFSVMASADYGVHVAANGQKRRILGSAPDIGACESRISGMIIILR